LNLQLEITFSTMKIGLLNFQMQKTKLKTGCRQSKNGWSKYTI
jgi:hypothetical protein